MHLRCRLGYTSRNTRTSWYSTRIVVNGHLLRCRYDPHHVYSQLVDAIGTCHGHVYITIRYGIHELAMARREIHQDPSYLLL
jgi:hypothetical protein